MTLATRVPEIKTLYGLKYADHQVTEALKWARKIMLAQAFIKEEIEFTSPGTSFELENYVMDSNFDGQINSSDLMIEQYLSDSPYTVTQLNAQTNNVIFDHPKGKTIIVMNNSYPTGNNIFKITYYRGIDTYENLKEYVRKVEELFTIQRLFTILEPYKLQQGLPDKSLNGVSINFDRQGIQDFQLKLYHSIQKEIMNIRGINMRNILQSKDYE